MKALASALFILSILLLTAYRVDAAALSPCEGCATAQRQGHREPGSSLAEPYARMLAQIIPGLDTGVGKPSSRRGLLDSEEGGYYPSDPGDYIGDETTLTGVARVSTGRETVEDDDEEEEGEEEESEVEEGIEEVEGESNSGTETESTEVSTKASSPATNAAKAGSNALSVSVAKSVRTATGSVKRAGGKKDAKRQGKKGGGGSSGGGGGGGGFRGLEVESQDGTNIKHLSYMVFKLIKQNNIKSVIDMPCRATQAWFPALLQRLDFEVIGLKYYCVDTDQHSQDDIRGRFSDAGSPEFLHIKPEEAHLLPKTDLVFSWDGPQQWGVKKTWSFFTALREIRPKFLMVTNNPKVANTNDKRGLLNLRKQPFHFSQALRVISDVHEGEDVKQLLFYEMSGVRRGF